ncbi:MAG: hypothetical protein ACM3S4_11730 [Burkholderiales bacterium]
MNGVTLGGGTNRYTFGSTAALTSYYGIYEKTDGTTVPLYNSDMMINQALNAVVISACYDDQSGLESSSESARCLIIAPSDDEASAESMLYSFAPSGLLSKFSTWNFKILF